VIASPAAILVDGLQHGGLPAPHRKGQTGLALELATIWKRSCSAANQTLEQEMDHSARTRREFAQQAGNFASSAAITAQAHVRRLDDPIGVAAQGRVLDIACGPGIVTAELAGIARDVVALDLTPEMLLKARERCAKAGRTNVHFEEGTANALPFDDASFDAVVTRLSFHHFVEPQRVLTEMQRVLKPLGLLAVADVVAAEDRE
jgi:ubiquinone/menaquinone biosynthesis C-methylase UbiE